MKPLILIIDDVASVRLYHASFLTRKGYRCLEASSGIAALELLQDNAVDLIVLDLLMPGMDGRAFITRLDTEARLSSLPVLIISSETTPPSDIPTVATRRLSLLVKPVMPAVLLARVEEFLPSPNRVREFDTPA